MQTLQTKHGLISADEKEDWKFIHALESGHYPNEDVVESLLAHAGKDAVVADIGANIGTVTVALAPHVKEVHCFEPVPRNRALLEHNIAQNNLTNVHVHPYALGDKAETISFFEEDEGNAGSYRFGEGRNSLTVEVRTLDSFELPITAMKIDVQGMESKVLLGGTHTIRTHMPVLFFEVSNLNFEVPHSFSTIHRTLSKHALYIPLGHTWGRVISLWLTTSIILPGVVFFKRKGAHFDILAVPKSTPMAHQDWVTTSIILFFEWVSKKLARLAR